MAFQAAYFGLYGKYFSILRTMLNAEDWVGRIECVYEPAMTKSFLHGRTEAIRSIQPESVNFTKVGRFLIQKTVSLSHTVLS